MFNSCPQRRLDEVRARVLAADVASRRGLARLHSVSKPAERMVKVHTAAAIRVFQTKGLNQGGVTEERPAEVNKIVRRSEH
jgi:hypothetical protein